jgi:hypothetical protein
MASHRLSWAGLLARVAAALALVYLTYNPEGYSFFHWVVQPKAGETGIGAYFSGFTTRARGLRWSPPGRSSCRRPGARSASAGHCW